jgi:hypothetical protein
MAHMHKEDFVFDQPRLGDNGSDWGFFENLIEPQFVDAESGDSWGSHMHSKGVMDVDGMDLLNIRTNK